MYLPWGKIKIPDYVYLIHCNNCGEEIFDECISKINSPIFEKIFLENQKKYLNNYIKDFYKINVSIYKLLGITRVRFESLLKGLESMKITEWRLLRALKESPEFLQNITEEVYKGAI